MKNNEAPDICRPCGGKCCQRRSGAAVPEDFTNAPDLSAELERLLRTQLWTFDYWIGDPREEGYGASIPAGEKPLDEVYYPRPATQGQTGEVVSPDDSLGPCVLWNREHGCSIQRFEERPFQCRALVPRSGGCKGSKEASGGAVAARWIPHQDLIKILIEKLREAP